MDFQTSLKMLAQKPQIPAQTKSPSRVFPKHKYLDSSRNHTITIASTTVTINTLQFLNPDKFRLVSNGPINLFSLVSFLSRISPFTTVCIKRLLQVISVLEDVFWIRSTYQLDTDHSWSYPWLMYRVHHAMSTINDQGVVILQYFRSVTDRLLVNASNLSDAMTCL